MLTDAPPCSASSACTRARARRRKRVLELANAAIDALNRLYHAPGARKCRRRPTARSQDTERVREVQAYVYACALDYVDADRCSPDDHDFAAGVEDYDVTHADGPVPLVADLVSLPAKGGGFPACDYVGPALAAFGRAEESALEDTLVAELAALGTADPEESAAAAGFPRSRSRPRSCHKAEPAEYAAVLARMHAAGMLELTAEQTEHPLGVFGVWKVAGEVLRLIVDGRPANVFFRTPEYEHTGGDSLARIQVDDG
ncbi:MAG: hypothetical protein VX747_00395, partial [Actinomycetota bacterium]|nr:hypothetical protein [Actinomycetota bacterium]